MPGRSSRSASIGSAPSTAAGWWPGHLGQRLAGHPDLHSLAGQLYRRIDWRYWTAGPEAAPSDRLLHGQGQDGRFLPHAWDRLNAETAFMYVLAVGAETDQATCSHVLDRPGPAFRLRLRPRFARRRPGPLRLPVQPGAAGFPAPRNTGAVRSLRGSGRRHPRQLRSLPGGGSVSRPMSVSGACPRETARAKGRMRTCIAAIPRWTPSTARPT